MSQVPQPGLCEERVLHQTVSPGVLPECLLEPGSCLGTEAPWSPFAGTRRAVLNCGGSSAERLLEVMLLSTPSPWRLL